MQVKTLNARHPEYDEERLNELFALYKGGRHWEELKTVFLPKNYVEHDGFYQDRLNRACYTPHASFIVDLIAAWLFEEEPKLSDHPDSLNALVSDANGAGMPLASFVQDVFVDALIAKHGYVWVNLPKRDPDLVLGSRLEEEELGLHQPFLAKVDPRQVIDWELDDSGKLLWVMIYDCVERRTNPLAGARTKIHRWTYIDADVIRRWHWTPPVDSPDAKPGDNEYATEQPAIEHNLGHLPIHRLTVSTGLWVMNKLHDPAIDLLRKENDLAWGIHKSAHPLLVIQRTTHNLDNGADVVVGPGFGLEIESDESVEYVEPAGRAFEAMAASIKEARYDLFRVVQQMALSGEGGGTSRAASGAAKSRDWESLQIAMSAYARYVRDFLIDMLKATALVAGETAPELKVSGMNKWKKKDARAFLELAALSVGAQTMSPTGAREVAKVQLWELLKDHVTPDVWAEIQAELDEADPFMAAAAAAKKLGDDHPAAQALREQEEQTTDGGDPTENADRQAAANDTGPTQASPGV